MNKNKFYELVNPYSMTGKGRIEDLYDCLEYIRINNIKGDMVECGVWKGGNILGIAEYLHFHQMYDRNLWLYDTFAGLTKPTEKDFGIFHKMSNNEVVEYWEKNKQSEDTNAWCLCDLDTVKKNLSTTNFPKNQIKYVVGDILETLKITENIPTSISILRLDTDWYESTKIEMEILYPKLNINGVLIIDDYGYWNGNKQAVDEYFVNINPDIKYIDDTSVKHFKKIEI